MEQILEEQIKNRTNQLPPVIRKAIDNSNWEAKVRRIVSINNLRVDQGAAIEETTRLTMLGFKEPKDFLKEIMSGADMEEGLAREITEVVGKEVFQPIKDDIIRITRKEAGLPEERDEIDEILYGDEAKKLEIYNIESSLETEGSESEDEVPITREQITKEIEDDIEILPETKAEIEKSESEDLMSKKLQSTTRTEKEEQKIDPYREPTI